MTDLTDKWKKGELPEDWYYLEVKEELANYPIIAECAKEWALGQTYSYFLDYYENSIKKVLAKVPTYEEYQALLSDQLAKNEGVEINAELKAENNKLKSRLDYITTASDYDIGRLQEDCHTLAQKLLQVKPELREWLEINYKEYL